MVNTIIGFSKYGKDITGSMEDWNFNFPFRAVLLNDNRIHTPLGRSIYFITE